MLKILYGIVLIVAIGVAGFSAMQWMFYKQDTNLLKTQLQNQIEFNQALRADVIELKLKLDEANVYRNPDNFNLNPYKNPSTSGHTKKQVHKKSHHKKARIKHSLYFDNWGWCRNQPFKC